MLCIGAAQADITPTLPVLMGGSFLMVEGRESHDPIMASCVVADDGRTRVALASCDLGSVPQDMTLAIREQVGKATGTPHGNIHLMATHNHSCPTVFHPRDLPFHEGDEASQARRDATRRKLVADIAACMIQAHARLEPARMGHGRGHFAAGAYNRRFIMSNGRSRMHGGGGLERLQPEGPVDPEVQVVWFEDLDGRHLAVIVNYSSHAANLYGRPILSADFPGVMRNVLHGALGPDVPILYLQGCCGNVMCDDLGNPDHKGGMDTVRRVGRGLAGEALRIMSENAAVPGELGVSVCNRTLDLPYREAPLSAAEAGEMWARHKQHWDAFQRLDIEERVALLTSLRLERYKREASTEPAEINAFCLGDVYFVTHQAELFVECQLEIKKRFEGLKVICAELTNGRIGYVPTRLACAMGGYETLEMRFNPDAGERIRDASGELIEALLKGGGYACMAMMRPRWAARSLKS